MTLSLDRRSALAALAAGLGLSAADLRALEEAPKPKGNVKQSICRWCYGRTPLDKLCEIAKKLGYRSIELLGDKEVLAVNKAGLSCAIMRCASIADGLNRKANHDRIEKELKANLEFAAANGVPNVICMSGNRAKMDDEEALKNCAEGLKRVLGLAEKKKVTVVMEGLNSKVDHKDYQYDRTAWGVRLCKMVGSDRFKLLYDIYHMQIMEGDVIRTIKESHQYIAHYHTGGVPGRNEIDETQELNYAAIVKAILATKYEGYLGQEFIPKRDAVKSLAQAFAICDV
jgi:hydroxypyruvate isomerase